MVCIKALSSWAFVINSSEHTHTCCRTSPRQSAAVRLRLRECNRQPAHGRSNGTRLVHSFNTAKTAFPADPLDATKASEYSEAGVALDRVAQTLKFSAVQEMYVCMTMCMSLVSVSELLGAAGSSSTLLYVPKVFFLLYHGG